MDDVKAITRREFGKRAALSTALIANAASTTLALSSPAPAASDPRHAVVSRLGMLFIPSRPEDPGYKDLESYGITEYILQKFPTDAIQPFNDSAKEFFSGKTFLELDDRQQ